jgi:hypothetical protein
MSKDESTFNSDSFTDPDDGSIFTPHSDTGHSWKAGPLKVTSGWGPEHRLVPPPSPTEILRRISLLTRLLYSGSPSASTRVTHT